MRKRLLLPLSPMLLRQRSPLRGGSSRPHSPPQATPVGRPFVVPAGPGAAMELPREAPRAEGERATPSRIMFGPPTAWEAPSDKNMVVVIHLRQPCHV